MIPGMTCLTLGTLVEFSATVAALSFCIGGFAGAWTVEKFHNRKKKS